MKNHKGMAIYVALFLFTLVVSTAVVCFTLQPIEPSSAVNGLIERSKRGEGVYGASYMPSIVLNENEKKYVKMYINSHHDYTSYHILLALEESGPNDYRGIPNPIKAEILCSFLEKAGTLNDWGWLSEDYCYEGQSAVALISTGEAAIPFLIPLLDNRKPAILVGSKEATRSSIYQYRKADFAHRYICIILGLPYKFYKKTEERDREINEIKRQVRDDSVPLDS